MIDTKRGRRCIMALFLFFFFYDERDTVFHPSQEKLISDDKLQNAEDEKTDGSGNGGGENGEETGNGQIRPSCRRSRTPTEEGVGIPPLPSDVGRGGRTREKVVLGTFPSCRIEVVGERQVAMATP